jgi:hypothetical protein
MSKTGISSEDLKPEDKLLVYDAWKGADVEIVITEVTHTGVNYNYDGKPHTAAKWWFEGWESRASESMTPQVIGFSTLLILYCILLVDSYFKDEQLKESEI